MSGEEEAACIEAEEDLKQSPDFSIRRFLKHFLYKDEKILDVLREALRIAGLGRSAPLPFHCWWLWKMVVRLQSPLMWFIV
jgi:hypothetical protein